MTMQDGALQRGSPLLKPI